MKLMSRLATVFALLLTFSLPLSTASAQGTAFTYQGQLQNNGSLANGTYNLSFTLYNTSSSGTPVAGPVFTNGVIVSNGFFTVTIDFFSGPWNGQVNWLEIGVETNGATPFITLAPRQQVTPTPYAIYSLSANSATSVPDNSISALNLETTTLPNSGQVLAFSGSTLVWTNPGTAISATPLDTPLTIVSRDSTGSFSSESMTLDGNLGLPATASSSIGVLNLGGVPFFHGYGNQNIFVGPDAGNFTMSGVDNTAIGFSAFASDTTGNDNTASGVLALGFNQTGYDNTADGYESLLFNSSGSNNTANGFKALLNAGGNNNIALGFQAGMNVSAGNNNIEIGNQGTSADNSTILIGTETIQTNTVIAGIYGATAASGVAVYVNANGQLGTLTSSARFKQDIQNMGEASEAILSLRPVTFRYKPVIDPQGIPQFGLVAEDVQKVAPELVAHDARGKIYTVRYEAVNAMLLNEFLKEHRRVEDLESRIEKLEKALNQERGGDE
jgi:hypothetical protein